MNFKISASIQWVLVLSAGLGALNLGKYYSKQQANEMKSLYKDAVTMDELADAIERHNETIDKKA